MSDDQRAQMIFLMAALLLPVMGLMARRLPISTTLKLILVWASIFLAGAILVKKLAPLFGYDLT